MSAQLTITQGPAAGTSQPVSGVVCRIGGDPTMTLQVAGIEPHALTVQQRDGQYHVFNRSTHGVVLAGSVIPPSQSAVWQFGDELKFSEGVAVRLEVDETASWEPGSSSSGPRETTVDADTATSASNPLQQRLIIGLFFLLFGGYLFLGSSDSAAAGSQARFNALIEDLLAAPHDPRLQAVRQTLQRAYNLETLDYEKEAASEYAEARRILVHPRRTDDMLAGSSKVRGLEDRSVAFVRERLERLR